MPCESLQMCSKTESLCGRPVPQSQGESDRQVPPVPPGGSLCLHLPRRERASLFGKGKGGKNCTVSQEDRDGHTCSSGVPLGLRRLLTFVEEKMCWKTLLLLLLCYDAQATVAHRWSRGELLFIICLMLIILF